MVRLSMIVDVTRTIDAGPAIADPTDQIIADYRATIVAMKCAMSERLVRLGISMAQLNILHTLLRGGELPMSRLAELLNVSDSSATGLVDRMEERGFIERTRVPTDRRVVLVRITADGARILEENDALTDGLMRDVLSRLEPEHLPIFARAIGEFRAALETAVGTPIHDHHHGATAAPRSR